MEIKFNVTGAERKKLVTAVCEILNEPMNYMGAPTFAYTIGSYSIDRSGTLTGDDNRELLDALAEHGFIVADEQENSGDLGFTISMPIDRFSPEKLDNLCKLVNAKATLLKAALDADELPIQQTDETIDFPWFRFTEDSDTVKAYSTLISLLCKAALEKKHVSAKERIVENPKYAMRCFLLSLGFIGDEFKSARKILLKNLDGNSAFKGGAKKEVVCDEISE